MVEPLNRLLDTVDFDVVCYSMDWHPQDHISFIENVKNRPLHESSRIDSNDAKVNDIVIFKGEPPREQYLWPSHCVQGSWGAELHKDLKIRNDSIVIKKGSNSDIDSYSVFFDNQRLSETTLNAQLKSKGVTDVYVCGIAYDVCVRFTAMDAIHCGYRTILLDDCSRGVNLNDIETAKQTIVSGNGVIASSNEVFILLSIHEIFAERIPDSVNLTRLLFC